MNMIRIPYLWELFLQAIQAFLGNRLRTFLSIIGITLGIAAVIVIGVISDGGRVAVTRELETFGLKSVWVFRNWQDMDPRRIARKGSGIDERDYKVIREGCCSAVRRVTPIVRPKFRLLIRSEGRYANASISGVNENYMAINNDFPAIGRSLRVSDVERDRFVAVIGSEVSEHLFGKDRNPVGQDIRIGNHKFNVIGMLSPKSRNLLASIGSAGGESSNDRILIPYTVLQRMTDGNDQIDSVQAEASSLEQSGMAMDQIIAIFNRRHSGLFSYRANSMAKWVDNANSILDGVSKVGVVAASVSLVVGGIGIMNIMTTSVLERTKEIGLRKALGARRRDILIQFLMEAVVISVIGGVLGLLLGVAAGFGVAVGAGFAFKLSPVYIGLALTVAIVVGLASGFYPARRAAFMQPVEALRYD